MKQPAAHDALCLNHGSMWSFTFATDAARQWATAHQSCEDWQCSGDTVYVEHSCGADITLAMRAAGLTVAGRVRSQA